MNLPSSIEILFYAETMNFVPPPFRRCLVRGPIQFTDRDGVYVSARLIPIGSVLEVYPTNGYEYGHGVVNVAQEGMTSFLPLFARLSDIERACAPLPPVHVRVGQTVPIQDERTNRWRRFFRSRLPSVQREASVEYLIGQQQPSDPMLGAVRAEIERAYAAMIAYFQNVWYQERVGRGAPTDLPWTLPVVSQWRSFSDQASIVAGQLRSLGIGPNSGDADIRAALLQILTTRSIPGFSRHHWGTEIDVVSADSQSWRTSAALSALADFTHYEAPRFGFYTPYWDDHYPSPESPHYNSEPWHLSYYPIAGSLRDQWLAHFGNVAGLSWLLDRVAATVGPMANVSPERLRTVLGTLDLSSYQRNVVAPPAGISE